MNPAPEMLKSDKIGTLTFNFKIQFGRIANEYYKVRNSLSHFQNNLSVLDFQVRFAHHWCFIELYRNTVIFLVLYLSIFCRN